MTRRRAPRQASAAIRAARERAAPRTGLAAVQAAWAGVVGEQLAAIAEPVSERAGTLTVEVADTVWAQELDLMQAQLLERLRERVGGPDPRSPAFPRKQRPLLVSLYSRFAGNLFQLSGSSASPQLVFLWQLASNPDPCGVSLQTSGFSVSIGRDSLPEKKSSSATV